MGSCCSSCLKRILSPAQAGRGGSYSRTDSTDTETELTKRNKKQQHTHKQSSKHPPSSLTISDTMSAPTILAYDYVEEEEEEEGQVRVSGNGLALIQMPIEQDAAYWEWYIEKDDGRRKRRKTEDDDDEGNDDEEDILESNYLAMKFGVATKKDASFYQVQESSADEDSTPVEDGTALMRSISVTTGDTVGIAVQQSDLPMLQFLVNGELLSEIAINRFRGTVFPAIYLREGYTVVGIFKESQFKELSPHARFGPLMAARGIL